MPVISQPRTGCSGSTANGQSRAAWVFDIGWACAMTILPADRRDYGSAGTTFLDIRAVFAGKTGFLPGYNAAGCPIYDLFLVAN